MTAEELLRPRYELIADYPGNMLPIGHVFRDIKTGCRLTPMQLDKYPNLFRKMKWWEQRLIADLPEYARFATTRESVLNLNGLIVHVKGWAKFDDADNRATFSADASPFYYQYLDRRFNASHFIPSTEYDFNEQVDRKNIAVAMNRDRRFNQTAD